MIVAHNHPSGDPTPSPEDISVTRDLVAAGKLMDIELLDHLIIGHGGRVRQPEGKTAGIRLAQPLCRHSGETRNPLSQRRQESKI